MRAGANSQPQQWSSGSCGLPISADAAALPSNIQSKSDFYEHIELQLTGLLDGQRNWVTNFANASSVLFNSMNRFGDWHEKHINWAGFYLLSPLFPGKITDVKEPVLWLGPFCGQPACQSIASVPGRGVCADGSSLLPPRAVVVPNTEEYPGHIACDSLSQSEIVVPLVVPRARLSQAHREALAGQGPPEAVRAWSGRGSDDDVIIGVIDIDCVAQGGFDEQDATALQRIARLIVDACDW